MSRRSPVLNALFRACLLSWIVLAPSSALANAITDENALPGSPSSEWDVTLAGDATIQGFATDISVDRGQTIRFKVDTDAPAWHVEIYRLGYYQGNGARHVGSGVVTVPGAQNQPAPLTDAALGLVDCGNWTESAHWDVPANAVSGLYLARLVRDDTEGASHVVFVVRDDASHSDLLFKTADCTWQAYNVYGGNSLYVGNTAFPSGHAAKVSFNRPFSTRAGGGGGGASEDWLFNSEYPAIRFFEANGYDVTYTTDVDTDRRGNLISQHKAMLCVGHDEYWSAGERASVEAARDAGVHLAFLDGNEIYWKTRWEPSIDGSNTDHRTLVCYKEGTLGENTCGGKCDPLAGTWTGLWREGCSFSPPADGCRPENATSGQISWDGSTGTLRVDDAYKAMRFWRNTAVAALGAGQSLDMTPSTLGYEWDWQQFPATYPAGRVELSTTNIGGHTHHLSLYRAASGALVFGAGTVQWSWGLDSHHDRGNDPPSLAMQQATVNLFADMGAQPASLQTSIGLVAATASNDATAPVSAITAPAAAASVPANSTFTITGTASDDAGAVVGVEVSVDGGVTWSPATGTTSWSFDWTPVATGSVTIRSRAFDDLGNLESASTAENTIAVTVTPGEANCPCTIWSPSTVPGVLADGDANAVELGVKFRASVDGFITGVRYYKSTTNTGVHVGSLWSTAGAVLASATFSGEGASGWQEASFPNPVAITAGTTYVASYHTNTGHYSQDNGYFASAHASGPLRALADGEDGANGVYHYSATAAATLPTDTFLSSNYWVDVVFATSVGPDLTPPTVLSHVPASSASGVAVAAPVTVTFNEAIDPATVGAATFELRDGGNALVPAVVTWDTPTRTATLTPSSVLSYSSAYTATVKGGGADPRIKDLAGNALAADVTWSFTTTSAPPPPPTEGPGGPILVISAAANPFSRYFAEILRAEGLNEFTAMDVSLVTPAVLADYDVVLLGEVPLSASQVTMLTDWTTAGGTLIASRPDAQLAGLLGLTPAGGTLSDKYLLVNTASGAGAGIVGQTIQFHGAADLYTLSGATAVATLYSGANTATANPAITHVGVGANGGEAYAFTYDLARSVVYTRQGNPAWANQKRDGAIPPIRSDDQFFPDWVDFNKVAIPQADEQQRLLANAIILGNLQKKPLPRFWYLPKGLKAAIVETGDNHGDGGMQPRFDIYRTESPSNCSVADWECVRATGYLYVGSTFTESQATFYQNLGFEVAVHVNTNCDNFTAAQYQNFITSQFAAFHAAYPTLPLPKTNRNHCIAWSDWSTTAEVEAANGIRFDVNYYYWPDTWIQNRPGMFTGSGMPMRFAKLDGTLIDCYQGATEMPDESGESFPSFCDALLDKANGPEGYYGVFTTNMHFDNANHPGSNAIVASAQAHGVPVVSAQQMLDWVDGRNGSSFGGLAWSGNTLSFSIAAATGSRNMQAMLPVLATVGQLTGITRNAVPVAYTTQTIKGIQYAFFPADAGNYAATYAVDTTAPFITAVQTIPHTDGTATVTWTTSEASDSRVDYGASPGALTSTVASASPVTSHLVTLTGLPASSTWYYRVTSADAAANSATEPAPPAAPLSFTMPAPVCAQDVTTADFAQGTPGAGVAVAGDGDGGVILAPAFAEEFSGAALSAGWTSAPWGAGGTATVSGGALTVDGAHASTIATFTVGSSLEFQATYNSASFQNVGFALNSNFDSPWVTIGMGSATTNGVYARTSGSTEQLLSTATLGTPHRYRIDWTASGFTFWIDGVQAGSLPFTIGNASVVMVSDFNTGGGALSVDWLRVTPYAASGSYTSRVFDTGGQAAWDAASWNADTPAGTGLTILVRKGNVPVPDGTWTAFTTVPTSGASVGGTSRYLQYRADLSTTSTAATPVLRDLQVSCATGPDTDPPVISAVNASPGTTTATIAWTTDELAASRVDYGTSPGSLTSNVADPALVSAHSVPIAGLSPGATYYYRVTSVDAATNSATSPVPPATLSFATTSVPCPSDATVADFSLGAVDANTAIVAEGDGAVILEPAQVNQDFSGAALPADWTSAAWNAGGTATVAGGVLTVDGAHASTSAAFGPGRSLEFVATYNPVSFQNVGFAADAAFNNPWVTIGTGSATTNGVYARTSGGTELLLSTATFGSAHRYRIDWGATTFTFWIDGVQVGSLNFTIASNMVAMVSDFTTGGASVSVDWLRVTPYASAGTFLSRVMDGFGPTQWGAVTWNASLPAGTAITISARTGNTAAPDASWSAYDVLTNGAAIGANTRYVQYKADLTTAAPGYATPALYDVSLACTHGPDLVPPVVSAVLATPAASGQTASVTWSTDERSTSRVDYGTNPSSLGLTVSDPALVRSHTIPLAGLSPGVTYYYRVRSIDPSSNEAIDPVPPAAPYSFTTPLIPCFADNTGADFGGGTLSSTAVSLVGDGEVILAPTLGVEFSGAALPAGWTNVTWNAGGASTVSGGKVSVDGSKLASPIATGYTAGRVLEFVATFGAATFENAGFAAGDNTTGASGMLATGAQGWAVFGTAGSTTTLFARLNTGSSSSDVSLGTTFVGSSHRYRIEWRTSPDSVIFLIDGASVNRRAFALVSGGTTMRPGISDFATGGPALQVDWMRVTPYAANGTFASRVYDSGTVSSWGAMTWNAVVPAGTSLAMQVRKGNTPVPDGSWTAYAAVPASGGVVGGTGRYIQYLATMTANAAGDQTPSLSDVGVTCGGCNAGAPAVIASLGAAATGNAGSGRTNVKLTWSGVSAGDQVAVYRKGYGDYPLYRADHAPSLTPPATPGAALSAGWALSPVTSSPGLDAPPARDQWYYVAFVTNACGTTSGPSNVTTGTLDYLLGDVADGTAVCTTGGAGDAVVSTPDMSALGSSYGQTFTPGDARSCLDVGPTVDFGLRSRPAPDGKLNFEDLVLYALNFGVPLPAITAGPPVAGLKAVAGSDVVALRAPATVRSGERFDVAIVVTGTGAVHAVSAQLAWDHGVAEVVGMAPGALLSTAGGVALAPAPGTVDAAVLGTNVAGLVGSGDVAIVSFRALRDGDPAVRLATVNARDGANRPVSLGQPGSGTPQTPHATLLGPVFPNPFRGALNVSFSLARQSHATVVIYDLAGRAVRHLDDGMREAGTHVLTWDGRLDAGSSAPAGLYLVRFEAGEVRQTRRVQLIR